MAMAKAPAGAAMGRALRWACAISVSLTMPAGVSEAFAQAADQDRDAEAAPSVTEEMRQSAEAALELVSTDGARAFLRAALHLPEIEPRTLYIKGSGFQAEALTPDQFQLLPEPEREGFEPQTFTGKFYYYTRYGHPAIYARPIDLACAHLVRASAAEPTDTVAESLDSKLGQMRILDFGYGMIGQLRMLASLGADVVGVDVQPQLTALYSWPGDTGAIRNISREQDSSVRDGSITLVEGSYPGDAGVRGRVGGGFDLILTKNVLKRGYIHPERETTYPTIDLGVDDETFVEAWFKALNPGGLVMIYNISPKQNPPDQPFIPWADGRCPFDRTLLEQTGFEILAFNKDDSPAIHDLWQALGLAGETPREDLAQNLFAKYTLLRKPAK